MPLLENHIAVVTGSGSGIGHAIASGYAREGARVVLLDINEKTAAEAAREIREAGGRAESFGLDVTRREACAAVARRIAGEVGPVSILVNNAGIARRNGMLGAAEAVTSDWEDIIAINLTGVFNVTHAFLDALRATKGRIVNIGSIQSFVHLRQPSSPAYPPPSTACSASPRRSPPNSAKRACASMRSARASSRPRSTPAPAPTTPTR
jgi:3-oxoacyl-[acyl-carrier protein] reductase